MGRWVPGTALMAAHRPDAGSLHLPQLSLNAGAYRQQADGKRIPTDLGFSGFITR